MFDRLSEVALSGLLHFSNHKGTDLTWAVFLPSGLNPRIAVAVLYDLERHIGDILLDFSIAEFTSDETF